MQNTDRAPGRLEVHGYPNLILERDAFRIVFLEPNLGSDLGANTFR
jgi:hypothetical protein